MSLVLDTRDWRVVMGVPLFGEIDPETVFWLLEGMILSDHPDGGMLFVKGDPADRFFIVLDGRVNLYALTEDGGQSIIEVINHGESFAEGAIFASGCFPLNAELTPGTRLLEIFAAVFLKRLADRRGLATKLLASLAVWQRRLMREIADLKRSSPVQRLASYLLALAEADSSHPHEGMVDIEVSLPFAKAELASRIGITPESLSRAINRLKPIGVSSAGRSFLIENLQALRRFSGEA